MKQHKYPINKIFILACLLFIPLLVGLYSIYLGQDINWDLQNYHLYNPYAYLHGRIYLDVAPAGLQTYFTPSLDLVYFAAIKTLNPKFVGFMIGLIQGLSFVIIYKIANETLGKGREVHSLFLGLLGILSVGFLSEVGTCLHDSLIGVLSLISLWLSISAIGYSVNRSHKAMILISISGFVIGIACGLKLVFTIYALALLSGILIVPLTLSARYKLVLFFGVFAFAGMLLTGGYWYYKMWTEFGNPIFPLFNNIFHGDLALSEQINDARFLPRTLFEKLFYPAVFTFNPLRVSELRYEQISWIFGYCSLIILGITGLIQYIKPKLKHGSLSHKVIFITAFFGISYFLWLNMFGIYRYIIPLEILIPLLVFITIDYFLKIDSSRWGAIGFLSLITCVNLKGSPDFGHSNWANEVYRLEKSVLTAESSPGALYLIGQPLAWVAPALDLDTPLIQMVPNMPVSEAYWNRVTNTLKGRVGKQYAIFALPSTDLVIRANINFAKLGLIIDDGACDRLIGYLGSTKFEYRFCEVKPY